jgi:putative tryptophan/tyrosine transport system substrate-binding protein
MAMHAHIGDVHDARRHARDRRAEVTRWRSTVGCLVTLALLLASLAADAQQTAKVPTLGLLLDGGGGSSWSSLEEAFLHGLHDLGYVEGQTIAIERRDAERQFERLPELAAELVRRKVDVLVTGGVPGTRAAMQATTTIPIVMFDAGDPVGTGLVASLARPGGNVTGMSVMAPDVVARQLQLLKEAAPQIARVAVLYNSTLSATILGLREAQAAAPRLGLTILPMELRTTDAFDDTFATMLRLGADALLTFGDGFTRMLQSRIQDVATKSRLPVIYQMRHFVHGGGLMAYGPSYPDIYRRAAYYVDRILKGAKPADLPVEQPTKFELVINLKTAEALGLTIPPTLLFQADEVIK